MTLLDDDRRGTELTPDALIEEAREVQRRRYRRWGAALAALAALLALAAGGFFAFGGGGSPSVPAGPTGPAPAVVTGPLPAGIVLRAADPGGGLPWGVRLVHAGGWMCVQLGRVSGDQLGMVGIDRMFHDDGLFHPFAVSASYHATCAQTDGTGSAFLNVQAGAQPASGALDGYTSRSGCDASSEIAAFRKHRLLRIKPPAAYDPVSCPGNDLRFIQYGLLGPQAVSITYTYNRHVITEKTVGPDGAYLLVGPAVKSFCDQLPAGNMCGQPGFSNAITAGMIKSVSYRNGRTCTVSRLGPLTGQCQNVGYVPAKPTLSDSQVTSPVTAHLITAKHYCFTTNSYYKPSMPAPPIDIRPYLPCDGPVPANEIRDPRDTQGTDLVFSWTARRATTATSRYEFQMTFKPTGRGFPQGCSGGQGGTVQGRVQTGEHLTRAAFIPANCTGTYLGTVYYDPSAAPDGSSGRELVRTRSGRLGLNGPLPVGSFKITIK